MWKKSILLLTLMILIPGILPIFAEVTHMQLDKTSYFKGDSINIKGTVDDNSSGLVTIVLRDPENKFVLLSQSKHLPNNSFEQEIKINEKFQDSGTYNVTAFILNITAAKTQSFEFENIILNKNKNSNESSIKIAPPVLKDESKITNVLLESSMKEIENPIVEKFLDTETKKIDDSQTQVADFVDKTKKPEYYLDRYYGEPGYRSWFDRNYPNLTIEQAVGYANPPQIENISVHTNEESEIIPKDEPILIESQNFDLKYNNESTQVGLALGGLTVLFGGVYVFKKIIDKNPKPEILNKDFLKRKISSPKIDYNPMSIIKTRLAKGEITVEDYEELRQKLKD
jgi:hypothetical protein